MSRYFVKYANTRQKFTKSSKGEELKRIVNSLEHVLLQDYKAVKQIYHSLSYAVLKLNRKYPRTKDWSVYLAEFSILSSIYVRSDGDFDRLDDNCVARITIVPVTAECDYDGINRMIKKNVIMYED